MNDTDMAKAAELRRQEIEQLQACTCAYPKVRVRNTVGHPESCPAYAVWQHQHNPNAGDPPKKRYLFTLELDAHDLEHALTELQVIVNDAQIDGFPTESVSSAGYILRWVEVNPGMTKEAYNSALSRWFNRIRNERRTP